MWRRTAPFHVQLELEKPQHIRRVAGDIKVQGRAVRVFRTDGRLTVGDQLAFALWACDPAQIPTGPAYIYFDDWATANYIEAYLFGNPPELHLAGYEFSVIRAPTDGPTLTPGQLEELLGMTKKWWQFWRR